MNGIGDIYVTRLKIPSLITVVWVFRRMSLFLEGQLFSGTEL